MFYVHARHLALSLAALAPYIVPPLLSFSSLTAAALAAAPFHPQRDPPERRQPLLAALGTQTSEKAPPHVRQHQSH